MLKASRGLVLGLGLLFLTGCGSQLGAMSAFQTDLRQNFGGLENQSAVPGEYLIKRRGVAYLDSPTAFAQKYGMRFVQEIEVLGIELFEVSNPSVLNQIQAEVEFASPNYIWRSQTPQATATPYSGSQINAYTALISSGISDPSRFQGKLISGHNTLGSQGTQDDAGIGTQLAMQYAQSLGPGQLLMPIKALDQNGLGSDYSVALGIVKATEYGAKQIVVGAGSSQNSPVIQAAAQFAQMRQVQIQGLSGMSAYAQPMSSPQSMGYGAAYPQQGGAISSYSRSNYAYNQPTYYNQRNTYSAYNASYPQYGYSRR